ncbi:MULTISPECIES: response regulator transcription factor [unclassified Methylibium]|uniref:response regulator n=1 Tax=unclassified Methylibium TaxID=2633235 RepID=UPI0003F404BD|nr:MULTISPECIES: response regulator transcription factor [unclassified Methylibium]AIA99125.1 Protease production enhancer protein [Methylibium sp. T29]AIA99207.1 Protease production enhancer protein [Methylibium sp. T29-B]EWS56317.1 Protease production enhancer protein [Methylibium sp. T29]EWS60479.1 Protease production enhancer protein [Methylibium sp. T29-B]
MHIIVADDHPLFRDALVRLVQQVAPAAEVLEAANAAEVTAALAQAPDAELLLLDLRMPGAQGAASVARWRAEHPGVPIVVVSGSQSAIEAREVLAAGAHGCLRKSTPPELMLDVLAGLLDGSGIDHPALTSSAETPPVAAAPAGLTPRQAEVLVWLGTGASNKYIARALGLAEGTVKLHVAAVLHVLDARNRTEAVARAREMGLT